MAHKATEGQSFVDHKVRERWPRLREQHELMCGYHWVRPDSSMQAQAEHHARVMEELGWGPGVFTQLDWERTHSSSQGELRPMRVDEIEEWCDHHARLLGPGRLMVYVNPNVDPNYREWRAANPDVPHWLPNYSSGGPAAARELRATIHQWTASFEHAGFTSGVDANEVLDWAAVERVAGVSASAPATSVAPAPSQGVTVFKFGADDAVVFASSDRLTAVQLGAEQLSVLESLGATVQILDRSEARRFTLLGGPPPANFEGIWANA
jgi:hypothetical protein